MPNWSPSWFEYVDLSVEPEEFDNSLGYLVPHIYNRAKKILGSRSEFEINELIDLITTLWSEYQNNAMERLINSVETIKGSVGVDLQMETKYTNPCISEHLELMSTYNLAEFSSIEGVSWREGLALMALNALGEAIAEEEYLKTVNFSNYYQYEYQKLTYSSEYLVPSLELLSEAICLKDNRALRNSIISAEERISIRNSIAAVQRHAPVNKLKNKCVRFYLLEANQGRKKSYRQTAFMFYESLPEEERKLLKSSNAVRTLSEAISKFMKEKKR